jgi:hypothetical protein
LFGFEQVDVKLKEGGAAERRRPGSCLKICARRASPLLGATVGNGHGAFPPTPAMKRFANSLARQKGIKPPPGYETSTSICRQFLSEHAPKKAEGQAASREMIAKLIKAGYLRPVLRNDADAIARNR